MPSAAAVPRGPSVLALGDPADLLTQPGCPVCRHAAEAADRYFGWFALEGHGDPVSLTRLCASLGMCARHTRRLTGQPGSASRLTAVYQYLLRAAADRLAGKPGALAPCPACEHDRQVVARVLDTILDGLAEPDVRHRYVTAGGMCVPHLKTAAGMRRHRSAAAWAVGQFAVVAPAQRGSAGSGYGLDVLAGGPDPDEQERAGLRASLSPPGQGTRWCCRACLAAAWAERDGLARLALGAELCPGHLRDVAVLAGPAATDFLIRQAPLQLTGLAGETRGSARWRPGRGLRRDAGAQCPVCEVALRAAAGELRAGAPGRLCVRHVLALPHADPAAWGRASRAAAEQSGQLAEELAEAFRTRARQDRGEASGPGAAPWLRAVAFIDGGVFTGSFGMARKGLA